MCRAELSDLGDGGGDRRDPGTIHQEGSPGFQAGGDRAGPVLKSDGGEAGDGITDMECHSCHQKGHFARECPTNAMEGRSGNGQLMRHNRRGTPGGCGDGGIGHGEKRTIAPWTDRGERG